MAERKKGAGGKLSRSEVVTVRLDPRLRYGVELAARNHRRTASSFIEWAIERTLQETILVVDYFGMDLKADEVLAEVWDVDEPDRFAKLASKHPQLLIHEEQVLWKVIRECDALWIPDLKGKKAEPELNYQLLRENWDVLNRVAQGDLPKDVLEKIRPL